MQLHASHFYNESIAIAMYPAILLYYRTHLTGNQISPATVHMDAPSNGTSMLTSPAMHLAAAISCLDAQHIKDMPSSKMGQDFDEHRGGCWSRPQVKGRVCPKIQVPVQTQGGGPR